ncbi:hypothetical protein C8Q79DRAFT_214462 [Trametes meyenii]|nr:hypothetical protein C8Q79DRAFT_214462 [Trametes meyenii]
MASPIRRQQQIFHDLPLVLLFDTVLLLHRAHLRVPHHRHHLHPFSPIGRRDPKKSVRSRSSAHTHDAVSPPSPPRSPCLHSSCRLWPRRSARVFRYIEDARRTSSPSLTHPSKISATSSRSTPRHLCRISHVSHITPRTPCSIPLCTIFT